MPDMGPVGQPVTRRVVMSLGATSSVAKRILVIVGHPDATVPHFGHALADAYAEGAESAGHLVRRIDVARLEFPLLRSQLEFEKGDTPAMIQDAQETLLWADHLVLVFPLWLGCMPALLKGFLEQTLRPSFTRPGTRSLTGPTRLAGKSARVVVTMGMPAFAYRWYFGAHGVKMLRRNVLQFSGYSPVRTTLVGAVEAPRVRGRFLALMRGLGRDAG